MGITSDAIAPHALMTGGSLLGAVATQLFGMSGLVSIFFLSRSLEGLGGVCRGSAAACTSRGHERTQCRAPCQVMGL